jgi:hypothetical protein
MNKFMKLFGSAGLLGALLLIGGCGSDDNNAFNYLLATSTTSAISTPATVTQNADGSAKTTTAQTLVPKDAPSQFTGFQIQIPADTTITAIDASGKNVTIPLSPTFVLTLPNDTTTTHSGVNGVPVATGFTSVKSTVAAVDIKINLAGVSEVKFSNPVKLVLPVPGGQTSVQKLLVSKNGTSYNSTLTGPFTVTSGAITIEVSNLCWFVGDAVFLTATGSTGSGGSGGF